MRTRLFFTLCLLGSTPIPAWSQDLSAQCPQPIAAAPPPGAPAPEMLTSHRFATGRGVTVAVIDTGVAAHPRLGAVIPGGDFIAGPDPAGALLDCDGHGTVVAGVIAARPAPDYSDSFIGIAPEAEILSIRQSSNVVRPPRDSRGNRESTGTVQTLADAIALAVDKKAGVINVSLASCIPAHTARSADTSVLDAALRKAEHAGVVVIAAAGNLGPSCPEGSVAFPAASPTVVAVSASADSHLLADYSLPVTTAPISAPGSLAIGLSPTGAGFATGMSTTQGDAPFTGTSFAAPVVSGMAAQLKERYPHDSAAQIRDKLRAAASPGTGHIEAGAALMQLGGTPAVQQATVAAPIPEPPRIPHRAIATLLTFLGTAGLLAMLMGLTRRSTNRS